MASFCTNCGSLLGSEDRFCTGCGASVESSGEAAAAGTSDTSDTSDTSGTSGTSGVAGRPGRPSTPPPGAHQRPPPRTVHRRPRPWWPFAIAGAVVVVGAAAAGFLLLGRSTSSPTSAVRGYFNALKDDNYPSAVSYIDPANRPAGEEAKFEAAVGAFAFAALDPTSIVIVRHTTDGSHAWVTVENASDPDAGTSAVPCELVEGTWYVYLGATSWASNPPSPNASTTTTTTAGPATTAGRATTATTTTATTPPTTMPGTASITSVASSEPDAKGVVKTLSAYFDDIDSKNYTAAYAEYSPTEQGKFTEVPWEKSLATTQDTTVLVISITPTPTGVSADVSFTSHQTAAFGATGQTCTAWTLSYALSPANGAPTGYVINTATPIGAGHGACP